MIRLSNSMLIEVLRELRKDALELPHRTSAYGEGFEDGYAQALRFVLSKLDPSGAEAKELEESLSRHRGVA